MTDSEIIYIPTKEKITTLDQQKYHEQYSKRKLKEFRELKKSGRIEPKEADKIIKELNL